MLTTVWLASLMKTKESLMAHTTNSAGLSSAIKGTFLIANWLILLIKVSCILEVPSVLISLEHNTAAAVSAQWKFQTLFNEKVIKKK